MRSQPHTDEISRRIFMAMLPFGLLKPTKR